MNRNEENTPPDPAVDPAEKTEVTGPPEGATAEAAPADAGSGGEASPGAEAAKPEES